MVPLPDVLHTPTQPKTSDTAIMSLVYENQRKKDREQTYH